METCKYCKHYKTSVDDNPCRSCIDDVLNGKHYTFFVKKQDIDIERIMKLIAKNNVELGLIFNMIEDVNNRITKHEGKRVH